MTSGCIGRQSVPVVILIENGSLGGSAVRLLCAVLMILGLLNFNAWSLPWQLRLSEEVAFITASESDTAPRWQIGLTRSGFFAWTQASSTVTVYNLEGAGAQGYGARFFGFLPLFNYRLIVQPEAGVRMLTPEAASKDLSLSYASLRLDGRFSKRWTLFGGLTYTAGDNVSSNLLDAGLRYTW
jgi:hypothetical protein